MRENSASIHVPLKDYEIGIFSGLVAHGCLLYFSENTSRLVFTKFRACGVKTDANRDNWQ